MLSLLGILLVPVVVGLVAFFLSKRANSKWEKITAREFILMEVIAAAVATAGFFYVRYKALEEPEYWNGAIILKSHGAEGCCHCTEVCSTCTDSKGESYDCNCHDVCDHAQDYWWGLSLFTGDRIMIKHCESNPAAVPAAWANAKMLEPASAAHKYRNYLKADPDSLLHRSAPEAYRREIPPFPHLYGYYKVDKVVAHGLKVPPQWNEGVKKINADISDLKQVDLVMVFTWRSDPAWADALKAEWLYGPKNALIVVAGVPDGETLSWVRVVTISRVPDLEVSLREGLTGRRLSDYKPALAFLRREVEGRFQRTPMAEYEYLASAASPPWSWLIGLYVVTAALTSALAFVFHKKDVL